MGIGNKAMRFAIAKAKKLGFRRLELEVVSTHKRAYALYKRLGFQKEGVLRKRFKIGNKYLDAIAMSKWIG